MDTDFNEATAYKFQADNAAIEVTRVNDEIDGDEYEYSEVLAHHRPLRRDADGLTGNLASGLVVNSGGRVLISSGRQRYIYNHGGCSWTEVRLPEWRR